MSSSAFKPAAALAFCVFLCVAASTALAQEAAGVEKLTGTLKKVRDTKKITIGYREASVPFSYLSAKREPIGYSIDLCMEIVEDIRGELSDDTIQTRYVAVNPQTRIPLVMNGEVDLECGQTTNNAERRKQVAFSPVIFVSGTKLMVRRSSNLKSYRDLKGRTVVATEGSTNEAAVKSVSAKQNLGITVVPVADNAQALLALDTGKADAWAGDDAVLYASAAESKSPTAYAVLDEYLSYDPYGIMYRKDDPELDRLVKRSFERLAETRELARIYEQWFLRKLPSGRTLGLSMSPQLESIFEALGQPTE